MIVKNKITILSLIWFFYLWYLLPDFLLKTFVVINLCSILFRFLGAVLAGFILIKYYSKDKALIVIVFFIMYMLFNTMFHGIDVRNLIRWGAIYVDIFAISVYTHHLIKKSCINYFKFMNYLCLIGLVINAFTVFFLKNGLVLVPNEAGVMFPYYFYDYDNFFIIRYIYTNAIVYVNDLIFSKKNLPWVLTVEFITLLYLKSIGSLLALLLFIVFFVAKKLVRGEILNIKTIWVGYIFLTCILLIGSSTDILSSFMTLFGKSISFGKRIYMWGKTVDMLPNIFLFGTGVINTTDMRELFRYAQLHNSFANILLWGGGVGFVIYCFFIKAIYDNSKKDKNKEMVKVFAFLFLSVMIASLMDGLELRSGIYIFYFIAVNYKTILLLPCNEMRKKYGMKTKKDSF